MIECQICHKEFKQITYSHLKKYHNISMINYRNMFPAANLVSDDTKNNISIGLVNSPNFKNRNKIISIKLMGHKVLDITKKRISNTRIERCVAKGKNNPMYGTNRSGADHPMYGKHQSEETKEKLKNRIVSEQTKLKMCENHADVSGEKHPRFNNWSSRKPYCEKWTEEKREEIRNKYNRRCVICDRDEKDNITKTGKHKKLSVHHVDEDKEQGCNGKPWNLKPLCMYCHNKIRGIII